MPSLLVEFIEYVYLRVACHNCTLTLVEHDRVVELIFKILKSSKIWMHRQVHPTDVAPDSRIKSNDELVRESKEIFVESFVLWYTATAWVSVFVTINLYRVAHETERRC